MVIIPLQAFAYATRAQLSFHVQTSLAISSIRGQGPISVRDADKNCGITFVKCRKTLKLGTNKLELDFKLLPKIFLDATISTEKSTSEIDADFGAKWKVTVPNFVTPIKPIVCKWIYMSYGFYCQMTHELYINKSFIGIFVQTTILSDLYKIQKKNAALNHLVQQEFNVAYETSISWSMFMLHKYWWKQLSWRNRIRY